MKPEERSSDLFPLMSRLDIRATPLFYNFPVCATKTIGLTPLMLLPNMMSKSQETRASGVLSFLNDLAMCMDVRDWH